MIVVDDTLPIAAHSADIVAALAKHQVLIVAGETGSGKTTQLPKICLLAGRERIGHTQPRRIAARTVAERIAQEMGETLGERVGYQVRFHAQRSVATQLKIMTDGILLAEISHDRELRRYDTIIIDEAHERSLNIDFLLGYFKNLLPKRPDLKLIVTSATIDTNRFSQYFDDAPIFEVSGRTYPVEIKYRPIAAAADRNDLDVVDGITAAVSTLATASGDILVFCSGEREIKDAAEALRGLQLANTEILPLYARLAAAEQHRIFAMHSTRRIVLATNVAETSLTVPGIRYVIDPGFARISRYSTNSKVQRLPIEPISQASANQRAGRCGRLGPGICIRLYSSEDFLSRPAFTEPEILRTNLAAVILQMAQARLGAIKDFPFIDPPDTAQIRDGMRLLRELGALDESRNHNSQGLRLTKVGRVLARLQVDPRLGRMLVEADRQGVLAKVLVIVAGLAIPDVRERPSEFAAQADLSHSRFQSESDIWGLWELWQYLRERRKELSGNAFRRMCREEYFNYLRVREWQDLRNQLRDACNEIGMKTHHEAATQRDISQADMPLNGQKARKQIADTKARAQVSDRVHTAVLSGLLSHIGIRDDTPKKTVGKRRALREYSGAHGARFAIFPGSAVAKNPPELIMAVELVETGRLWAREVAPIDPAWIEEVGGHLLRRNYFSPHWSLQGGQCVAYEKVSLFGIPIVERRLISYAKIDPVAARTMFIQEALVAGEWHTKHDFWLRNERVRAAVTELEERTRRRDLLVTDQVVAEFYDARIPQDVVSVAHFDSWWRNAAKATPQLLDIHPQDLLSAKVADVQFGDFPETWPGSQLAIEYIFDPGTSHDGVSVDIPLSQLLQLNPASFTWQVPGLREELITELIRALPKQLRTQLVPAPDTARVIMDWLREIDSAGKSRETELMAKVSLPQAMSSALTALKGIDIAAEVIAAGSIPDHLQIRFRVLTPKMPVVGRNLSKLAEQLLPKVTETLNISEKEWTHPGAAQWDFGNIPMRIGKEVTAYPALVDKESTVGMQVFPDEISAQRSHRNGIRRLIALTTVNPVKSVVAHLSNPIKLALSTSPYASVPDLLADARLKAISDLMGDVTGIRDEATFTQLRDQVRSQVAKRMQEVVNTAGLILQLAADLDSKLALAPQDTRSDLTTQLADLIHPGFIAATMAPFYERIAIYLQAMGKRIDQAIAQPDRDLDRLTEVWSVLDKYDQLCDRYRILPDEICEIGWLIEELRVGIFAQSLGTIVPVSVQRLNKAISQLS